MNLKKKIQDNADALKAEQYDKAAILKELTANPPPAKEIEQWLKKNNKRTRSYRNADTYRQDGDY